MFGGTFGGNPFGSLWYVVLQQLIHLGNSVLEFNFKQATLDFDVALSDLNITLQLATLEFNFTLGTSTLEFEVTNARLDFDFD